MSILLIIEVPFKIITIIKPQFAFVLHCQFFKEPLLLIWPFLLLQFSGEAWFLYLT